MLYTIYENYEVIRALEIEANSPEEAIRKAKKSDDGDWFNEPDETIISQRLELTLPVEKSDMIVEVVDDGSNPEISLDHDFEELKKALKINNDGE